MSERDQCGEWWLVRAALTVAWFVWVRPVRDVYSWCGSQGAGARPRRQGSRDLTVYCVNVSVSVSVRERDIGAFGPRHA